jgi:hypothetical protein
LDGQRELERPVWRIWLKLSLFIALYTAPGEQPGLRRCYGGVNHAEKSAKIEWNRHGANCEEKHGRPCDAERPRRGLVE